MIKGVSRRVVVVKSPDPRIFEQAIFIVREDFLERFARREPVYRQWADYVIQGHSEAVEAAQRILEVLK